MICNTPQQLWQRAKEALLSKLVTHPNLVRTLAMDVTLVTPNTYKEWGANNTSTTAAATARGQAHNGMGAGMASVATSSAAAPAAGAPAPAQAAGRASMDAPAFAAGALHGGGGGGGGGSGSGSGSGSGAGSGAAGAGSGGSGNGRVFQSVACSPSHPHSFLAADATCGTTAGGTTVTSTTALMVSTANTLSASLGCCPISNTAVAAADGSVTVAAAAQHPNQRAASGAGAGGLLPVDVAASSASSCGPGAGGEGPAAVAGTAALQQWPGARDVLAPAGREASSDGARTVGGGTSVEVPTPQLPLSANGHSSRALSTVEASVPEGGSVRGPAAGSGAEVAVVGPDPAAGAPQAQAPAARPLAPPPAINAVFVGGSGGSNDGAAGRGLLGLQGSVESSAAGLLPANALSPTGAPTQPPTPLPGPHGGGAPAGGAAALGNSGSGRCASAVSLLSPLMAPSGTATAACSPLPHTAPSRESSQRSLCPAMPSNGHVSIGAGAGSGMVAAVAAMHATSGVHAHAVAAGPGGGGGGVMRPGGPGSGGGDPVPFQDILYHLDAIPGRFLAKVIMVGAGRVCERRGHAGKNAVLQAGPAQVRSLARARLEATSWCVSFRLNRSWRP